MRTTEVEECLQGKKLYGDDFSPEEIILWFKGEREGYADLWAKDRKKYEYEFHAFNRYHFFRHLPRKRFSHVLSVGGAYGDELLPIIASISGVTILEPSDAFLSTKLGSVPVEYVKPIPSGDMPFPTGAFDLATCFGCLHHVPNVSKVIRELYRSLIPGGIALVREPIISMGDWRFERTGLTRQERGIPLGIFRRMLSDTGFLVRKEGLCGFPLIPRLTFGFGKYVYNSITAVVLDSALSRLFSWNQTYHATRFVQKFQPTVATYVVEKPRED